MGKSEHHEDLMYSEALAEILLENRRRFMTRRYCLTRHAQNFNWAVTGRELVALLDHIACKLHSHVLA
jgi:hypothetical protein